MTEKFIAYIRVSTTKQGASGLGLEAQERDINLFLDATKSEVSQTFKEVQSGSNEDRGELQKALKLARATGFPILVSKLDRLSRSVAFIASLLDDDRVKIKVACMPEADKFQLHIYAALAQQEREFISERTKAGLQSAKARGVRLGNPQLRAGDHSTAKAASRALKAQTDAFYATLAPFITDAIKAGANTNQKIANALIARGVKTSRSNPSWSATTVQRARSRMERLGLIEPQREA